ncbi:MAG: NYN domain-containing protein [Eubacterium coprostanoligenes]|nr:NYN domain-containing protein [Eubacterium coprostanoligenes]
MQLEDLQYITFDEEDDVLVDKAKYSKYSKNIALTLGYLLGVRDEQLDKIPESESQYYVLKEELDKNENALAIRYLNNIRSNLMLLFKKVSYTIRVSSANFTPLYKMEEFEDDFEGLKKLDIHISTGRSDINEYITIINSEISKRLDGIKSLFPDWVEFRHIKQMFTMPKNIKPESERFQSHQTYYPYRRYFYWSNPEEMGNILLSDVKLLSVVYESNGSYFQEVNKVVDTNNAVKDNINEFINNGRKIQIFIDGENVDPYRFASAIDSLKDYEIEKIDKITVYYDNLFSNRAWTMLQHFTFDIEVEAIGVNRIKEDKSLVDHKLVAGVSKAVYKNDVDSIIIASSDSDFWSVMEDVPANYLVMMEKDKCGRDFKEVLRDHDVFYCYLDKFITQEDNMFFKTVFRKELESVINASFELGNSLNLFEEVISRSRAYISNAEKETMYDRYIKGLKLSIDKEGNFKIIIPE